MLTARAYPAADALVVVGADRRDGPVCTLLLQSWSGPAPAMTLRSGHLADGDPSDPDRHVLSAVAWWGINRPAATADPLAPMMAAPAPGRERWQETLHPPEKLTRLRVAAAAGEIGYLEEELFGRLGSELKQLLEAAGWNPSTRLATSGLRIAEGRQACSACPGDLGLAGLAWYSGDGEAGHIRRQAAHALPLFAGVIAASPEIREAVDQRRSLTGLLRRQYPGLGAGGIKRLGRIRGSTADQEPLGEAFTAAADADALGNARRRRLPLAGSWQVEEAIRWLDNAAKDSGGIGILPETDDDWQAFTAIWSGMIMPMAANFFDVDQARMRAAKAGNWQKLLVGLGRDLGLDRVPDRRQLNVAVVDAAELAESLATDIVLPTALRTIRQRNEDPEEGSWNDDRVLGLARLTARDMLIPPSSGQPLRACAAAVRVGLTRLVPLEDVRSPQTAPAAPSVDPSNSWRTQCWESPWESWTAPNGARVTFLSSRDDMRAEGARMDHCIGRMDHYWRSCWHGGAIAAHIEPDQLAWLPMHQGLNHCWAGGATAYLTLDEQDMPSLSALHGKKNERVNLAGNPFCEAIKGFLAAARSGAVPRRPERERYCSWLESAATQKMMRTATPGRPQENPWAQLCQFDPMDADRTAALWQEWRQVMPGGTRIASPDAAVWRQPAAREMLRLLSPATHDMMLDESRAVRPPEMAP